MPTAKVNVELRVCAKDRPPAWGFVDDGLFFPIGPTLEDKKLALVSAIRYREGERDWKGIPLSLCGPNLDVEN